MRNIAVCCSVVMALLGSVPAGAATAVEQFHNLRQALVHDRVQKDWPSHLVDAERTRVFLNDSPLSNLELALADLQLGHTGEAAEATGRFLAMGQVNAILSSPLFQPLRPKFEDAIAANIGPVSRGERALTLSDPKLLPEDIDYDVKSQRFFVSSILQKKIVTVDMNGTERDFAASPDHWPVVALKVDAERRVLWATEVAFDGFGIDPSADWGRSVLLEYDLDRGTLVFRLEGPRPGNLGDMVLADNGDPIVSDGVGGGIYRVHDRQLRRIDRGDFVSPQTSAICPHSPAVFVPDYVRGVGILNPVTGSVRWLSTQDRYDLSGIDGLYCRGNLLIATQNGGSPERVISFALDKSASNIVAQTVIERGGALGDPTHGVFVGDEFYYIANSGWDSLDEHGALKPSATLTPARVMRVSLAKAGVGTFE
ncbi:MAG: hypothetical protein ABSC92_03470 [Rhizomicrobium sp.]